MACDIGRHYCLPDVASLPSIPLQCTGLNQVNTATQVLPNQTELKISARLAKNVRRHFVERVIEFLLMLAAMSAVATTLAIVAILLYESLSFFEHVSIIDFLTDTQWTPLFEDAHYGILPLVSGTLTTSAIALLVAIPIGTVGAIYLSEFASHKPSRRRSRKPMRPSLRRLPRRRLLSPRRPPLNRFRRPFRSKSLRRPWSRNRNPKSPSFRSPNRLPFRSLLPHLRPRRSRSGAGGAG